MTRRYRMARSSRHVSVVALSLAVGLAACGGATGAPQASTPSAAPSAAVGSIPSGDATIEPGTYLVPKSAWSALDFTVTIPEGWTVQYGHVYLKHMDTPDQLGFSAAVVDSIHADACVGSNNPEPVDIGPGVVDLAAALLEQPGPTASGPVDTALGGYPASRIDLTVPNGFDLIALQPGGYRPSDLVQRPRGQALRPVSNSTASVYVVDVEGQRQVFLTEHPDTASDEDLRELQAVLDSIQIKTLIRHAPGLVDRRRPIGRRQAGSSPGLVTHCTSWMTIPFGSVTWKKRSPHGSVWSGVVISTPLSTSR